MTSCVRHCVLDLIRARRLDKHFTANKHRRSSRDTARPAVLHVTIDGRGIVRIRERGNRSTPVESVTGRELPHRLVEHLRGDRTAVA